MRDVVSTSQGRIIFCVFVRVLSFVFLLSFTKIDIAHADGNVIDKVYHPYVDAMEKELEFRSLFQNLPVTNLLPEQVHQLSLGSAWELFLWRSQASRLKDPTKRLRVKCF